MAPQKEWVQLQINLGNAVKNLGEGYAAAASSSRQDGGAANVTRSSDEGIHESIVSRINTSGAQRPPSDIISSFFPSYASVAAKPGTQNGAAVASGSTNERIKNEDTTNTANQSEVTATSEQNGIVQKTESASFHEATSNGPSDAVKVTTTSSAPFREATTNSPSDEVDVPSLPISRVAPVIPLKFSKGKEPSLVPAYDRIQLNASWPPSPIQTPAIVPADTAQTLPAIIIQEASPASLASKLVIDWRADSTPLYSTPASKAYFPLPIQQHRAGAPAPLASVTDWRANAKPLSAEPVSRNDQIQPYLPLPIGNGRARAPATDWRANPKPLPSDSASRNFQAHLPSQIAAGRTSTALTNATPITRTFVDSRFGDSSSNSKVSDKMGSRGNARRAVKASVTRFFFCEGTTPTPIVPPGLERAKHNLTIQRELENIIHNEQIGSEAQEPNERTASELPKETSRISMTNTIAKPIPTGPKNMNMNRDRVALAFGPNRRDRSSSSVAHRTEMGPSMTNQHNEVEKHLQQRGISTPIPTAPKAMRGEEVATGSNGVARIPRGEMDPSEGSKSSAAQLGTQAKKNKTNRFGGLIPSQIQLTKNSPLERNAMTVSAPPEAKDKGKGREESRPVKMGRAATLPTSVGLGDTMATTQQYAFGENYIIAPAPLAGWSIDEAVNHFQDDADQLTVPRAIGEYVLPSFSYANEANEEISDAATVVQDNALVVAKLELETARLDAAEVNRPLIPGTNKAYAPVACELIGLPLSSHHGPRPHCIPQPWTVPKYQPSDKERYPRPRGGALNGGRFVLEEEWLLAEEENRADFIALPFQLRGNKDKVGDGRKRWAAPIMGLKAAIHNHVRNKWPAPDIYSVVLREIRPPSFRKPGLSDPPPPLRKILLNSPDIWHTILEQCGEKHRAFFEKYWHLYGRDTDKCMQCKVARGEERTC